MTQSPDPLRILSSVRKEIAQDVPQQLLEEVFQIEQALQFLTNRGAVVWPLLKQRVGATLDRQELEAEEQ